MTAASDSAVAPMEEALRFLSNSPTTAATTVESIPHVPGAIILRQLLTREECNNLAKEVRNVHLQWEEESKRRRNLSSSSSSSSSSTTTTTSTTTSSTTSDTSTSTTATTTTTNPVSRRRSQHHLPRRVSSSSLATLSARIRPYVAQVAGPKAPANSATLLPPGEELSTFLRCYHYKKGDTSTPHYDKSFTTSTEKIEKIEKGKKKRIGGGRLETFSAYSVLLYVSDSFQGGGTTFFEHDPTINITRRGLTPVPNDLYKLKASTTVVRIFFFLRGVCVCVCVCVVVVLSQPSLFFFLFPFLFYLFDLFLL